MNTNCGYAVRIISIVIITASLWGPAAAESASEVKKEIIRDIRIKEQAVRDQTQALETMYKEARTINTDARLDELAGKAEKATGDIAKMTVEQLKTGRITNAKDAAESIGRGKELVDKYKEIVDAQEKAIDAVMRQQELTISEIPAQEKKVTRAKADLRAAKEAASIVLPLLDAMEEAERIAAKRKAIAEKHHLGEAAAQRRLREYRPPISGPESKRDPLPPLPVPPPTPGGQAPTPPSPIPPTLHEEVQPPSPKPRPAPPPSGPSIDRLP